jgi:hypothetical protein
MGAQIPRAWSPWQLNFLQWRLGVSSSSPPPNASTAPWGPRPPHFPRLHDLTQDTPHSVGLLWMRDQPVAETST